MARWIHVAVILLILGTTSGALASEHVAGEVLIKTFVGASSADVRAIEALADADRDEVLSQMPSGSIRRIHSRSLTTEALVAALAHNPHVEYVEPNYLVYAIATPNDPRYGELWGLKNIGQVIQGVAGKAGADIKAEGAWDVTTGTSTVVVGVVDTGIDYNHTDLAANAWSNPGGIGGCAAGTHGFNAITKTCDPKDDQYHGTHVAGTIGASGNNAVGVVGVNWTTSLMGLKFLNSAGSGTTADAISAIDFAVNAKIAGVNVRVLSNSWGGGGFSQALLDEINKAGASDILFVAAAGNSASDNDVSPHYPSSYNSNYVLAVAATDNNDQLASFSNWGATSVDIGAPGVDILSCQPGNLYQYLSGTSMATPHVSGAAALILAKTNLPVLSLKSQILNNVDPIPSLSGMVLTGGRLNVCKAIGSTTCGGAPPDTTAPTTSITAPANGATVSGTTTVTASASDNVGVTKVEFYLDNVPQATDTTSPYSWSWNTTTSTNGSHALNSKAYDAAANVGTSATVTVTVSNVADTTPPTAPTNLVAAQPAQGNSKRKLNLAWTASTDNVGVTGYKIWRSTSATGPFSQIATATTTSYTNAGLTSGTTYYYYVQAFDAAGNVSAASNTASATAR